MVDLVENVTVDDVLFSNWTYCSILGAKSHTFRIEISYRKMKAISVNDFTSNLGPSNLSKIEV